MKSSVYCSTRQHIIRLSASTVHANSIACSLSNSIEAETYLDLISMGRVSLKPHKQKH